MPSSTVWRWLRGKTKRCCAPTRRNRTDERRTVALGDPQLCKAHPNNAVRTTKYSPLTFVPVNLWEQFHRPINVYFLLVATLQFIPGVAPVSPYTVIFPMTVAFSVSAIKDGVDDIRRWRQDRELNARHYTIVDAASRGWKEVKSKEIHVGDVILLRPFEIVPCDVMVLMTSGDGGEAYISTESLDGETGTKERLAVLRDCYSSHIMHSPTSSVGGGTFPQAGVRLPVPADDELNVAIDFLFRCDLSVDSEGPNPSLNTYNATLSLSLPRTRPQRATMPLRTESGHESFGSADERDALLRNCSGSASDSNPGTGQQYAMGAQHGHRKSLGVTIENVIIASSATRNTLFVLALVVFTGMETKVVMTRGAPPTKWAIIDKKLNVMTLAIFIFQLLCIIVYSLVSIYFLSEHHFWYLGGESMRTHAHEYFPILPLRYFTMLSPMVPISFKVMVELSKTYISNVIRWDDDMSEEQNGTRQRATVNNSALAEDLGQIEYILSDKTGTMTANTMTLAALATADGTVYECDYRKANELHRRHAGELAEIVSGGDARGGPLSGPRALLAGMTFCNTIERSLLAGAVSPPQSARGALKRRRQRIMAPAPEKDWASCSPDEVALVEGAELCGVTLLQRTRKMSRATFNGSMEKVDILKILPFTSVRGRMSVLVRRIGPAVGDARPGASGWPHGEFLLLMKGSDEKVLPLCGDSAGGGRVPKDQQPGALLERFSERGLRTLVYAVRDVPADEATRWLEAVEKAEATVSAESREQRIEEAHAALERGLVYCGCTAVEDQLQDQVAVTISQLRNASIRVWMLTGDKTETARQTAIASGLLTARDRVVVLAPNDLDGQVTTSERLEFTRAAVLQLLGMEPSLHRDEAAPAPSRLQRLYCGSGLKDYVDEFRAPPSWELLKPLNHPLRYNNIEFSMFHDDVARMTTLAGADGFFEASRGYSLLLRGSTIQLVYASHDAQLQADFGRVLLGANTVICSRMAPDQKTKIVEVVKAAGKMTLAIGDGGNDVAMIQAAHVGVGIKGKEGNHAALSADFAISHFRFLSRLLLVHGHTAYQRTAIIVQQSFWKSVLIAWVQLLFNWFTEFSGISFWDSYSLALYNAIPTVPVTFLCVMNVPLSPWMLVRNPQLYRMSQHGRYLNSATFYGYILRAMLQGTLVFFVSTALSRGGGGLLGGDGWVLDRSGDFYVAYISVVTVHTYTVLTESHGINFAQWQCFLFSVWSCFLCFYTFAVAPTLFNPTFATLAKCPSFYLSYIITTTVACFPQAIFASVKSFWFPDALQLQRTSAFVARSVRNRFTSLLEVLFDDDNPSRFWASWSPVHAFFCYQPPIDMTSATESMLSVAVQSPLSVREF